MHVEVPLAGVGRSGGAKAAAVHCCTCCHMWMQLQPDELCRYAHTTAAARIMRSCSISSCTRTSQRPQCCTASHPTVFNIEQAAGHACINTSQNLQCLWHRTHLQRRQQAVAVSMLRQCLTDVSHRLAHLQRHETTEAESYCCVHQCSKVFCCDSKLNEQVSHATTSSLTDMPATNLCSRNIM